MRANGETRIQQPDEATLSKLAMEVEQGPVEACFDHFDGWTALMRDADNLTPRQKVYARHFLTWTVCTPAERELLARHRKAFGTA